MEYPITKTPDYRIHKVVFNLNMPKEAGEIPHKNWWMNKTRQNALAVLQAMDKATPVYELWQTTNRKYVIETLKKLTGQLPGFKLGSYEVKATDLSIIVFNAIGYQISYSKGHKYFAFIEKQFKWHDEYNANDYSFGKGFFDDYPRMQQVKFYRNNADDDKQITPVEIPVTTQATNFDGLVVVPLVHKCLTEHQYIISESPIADDEIITRDQWEGYKEYLGDAKKGKQKIEWYDLCKDDKHDEYCATRLAKLPEEWRKSDPTDLTGEIDYGEDEVQIAGWREEGNLVKVWEVEETQSNVLLKQPARKEFAIIWGGDEVPGKGKHATFKITNSDILAAMHGSTTHVFAIVCANFSGNFGEGIDRTLGMDYLIFSACRSDEMAWHDISGGDYFMRYLKKEYMSNLNMPLQYYDWIAPIQRSMRGAFEGYGADAFLVGVDRPSYTQSPGIDIGAARIGQFFKNSSVPREGFVTEFGPTVA